LRGLCWSQLRFYHRTGSNCRASLADIFWHYTHFNHRNSFILLVTKHNGIFTVYPSRYTYNTRLTFEHLLLYYQFNILEIILVTPTALRTALDSWEGLRQHQSGMLGFKMLRLSIKEMVISGGSVHILQGRSRQVNGAEEGEKIPNGRFEKGVHLCLLILCFSLLLSSLYSRLAHHRRYLYFKHICSFSVSLPLLHTRAKAHQNRHGKPISYVFSCMLHFDSLGYSISPKARNASFSRSFFRSCTNYNSSSIVNAFGIQACLISSTTLCAGHRTAMPYDSHISNDLQNLLCGILYSTTNPSILHITCHLSRTLLRQYHITLTQAW
jgi:hypothetical protein